MAEPATHRKYSAELNILHTCSRKYVRTASRLLVEHKTEILWVRTNMLSKKALRTIQISAAATKVANQGHGIAFKTRSAEISPAEVHDRTSVRPQ
eukprot:COSAG02_NODE_4360_length_5455_cov_3.183159_3_plen_95_part_00